MKPTFPSRNSPLRAILFPLCALLLLVGFFTGLSCLTGGPQDAARQQLENAVRRSAITCYATEGVYPPDLEYLESHYGLQIDREHYTVFYEIFAENLMPDITVLEREP